MPEQAVPLSILDLSPVSEGSSAGAALFSPRTGGATSAAIASGKSFTSV